MDVSNHRYFNVVRVLRIREISFDGTRYISINDKEKLEKNSQFKNGNRENKIGIFVVRNCEGE